MMPRSEILVVAALLLCAAGCGPSEAQIRAMRDWISAARRSCTSSACEAPRACIRAVVAATEPTAGRAEYQAAQTACWPYGGAQ
jgi:hypothetical protein